MKNSYIRGSLSLLSIVFSLSVFASPALAYAKRHHWSIAPAPVGQTVASVTSITTPALIPKKSGKKTLSSPSSPVITPPASTPPPPTPPVVLVGSSGEVRMTAYTTAYGWPDNTPAGAAISDPVIHKTAGGTGTYADPITVAVGHSITGGQDILDYPAGTKFYVPNLRRYFIVEDTCGDGSSPQSGPCHTGYQGHVWIDLWIGGQGLGSNGTLVCEDAITDLHLVIENPASNYAVVSGAVYNGTCSKQYGDSVVTN